MKTYLLDCFSILLVTYMFFYNILLVNNFNSKETRILQRVVIQSVFLLLINWVLLDIQKVFIYVIFQNNIMLFL